MVRNIHLSLSLHLFCDGPSYFFFFFSFAKKGHTHIDILKIDIEGWEFETLTSIVKTYIAADQPLPFGQLQLEIHAWNKQFHEFLTWWERLEEAGLRPYMTEVRQFTMLIDGHILNFSSFFSSSPTWYIRIIIKGRQTSRR